MPSVTYAARDLYTARDHSEPLRLVLLFCGCLPNITWCRKMDKLTPP